MYVRWMLLFLGASAANRTHVELESRAFQFVQAIHQNCTHFSYHTKHTQCKRANCAVTIIITLMSRLVVRRNEIENTRTVGTSEF